MKLYAVLNVMFRNLVIWLKLVKKSIILNQAQKEKIAEDFLKIKNIKF